MTARPLRDFSSELLLTAPDDIVEGLLIVYENPMLMILVLADRSEEYTKPLAKKNDVSA